MTAQHSDAVPTDNVAADREHRAFHLGKGDGPAWWFLGTRMIIKADRIQTGGAFTLIEFSAPLGYGPPRHVHHDEDEAFFILAGRMRVACGSKEWDAHPGSFVFLPRGVPHAFVVTSLEPVVGLQLTSPAGFEDFIAEMGRSAGHGLPPPSSPDVERLAAAAARHGNEIVGSPLSLVKKGP
jgi:mannose-6-phosphate isomerase-like protein (cupin superfamily)